MENVNTAREMLDAVGAAWHGATSWSWPPPCFDWRPALGPARRKIKKHRGAMTLVCVLPPTSCCECAAARRRCSVGNCRGNGKPAGGARDKLRRKGLVDSSQ